MTNEELVKNIWATAGLHSNELHEWRAELLRRLGAAVSAPPQPSDDKIIKLLDLVEPIARAVCKVESLDPDEPTESDREPNWVRYADAIQQALLAIEGTLFAAAPAQEREFNQVDPTVNTETATGSNCGNSDRSTEGVISQGVAPTIALAHSAYLAEPIIAAAQEQPVENGPILQWLNDRVHDERGAIEFGMTEDGNMGLFRSGEEKPWATGGDVEEVLCRAAKKYPSGKDCEPSPQKGKP